MPSLSIDQPHPLRPVGNSPSPNHHRLNRVRRPHHLRIHSPPKSLSPLIFSNSYHPHHHHHHPIDPTKILLTPELVYSQQNQASPWKGIIPQQPPQIPQTAQPSTTNERYFTSSSSQRTADSLHSIPKISIESFHSNNSGSNSIAPAASSINNGSSLHLSNSQQNFLQRLHYEKQQQQAQAAAQCRHSSSSSFQQQQQSLINNNKNYNLSSSIIRNDDSTSSTKFHSFPEEISLMRMDEDFAPFNTEIDFTQPDPSRPLQIRVSGRSIYVDPQFAQDLSPIFTNFLARELVAGKRKCVEMQRDDISFPEVLEMAKVLCPYELGMFPKPVEVSTFRSLSRLSNKFKVGKLKLACELFIARMSLDDPKISTDDLCSFIVSSYIDGLTQPTKIRLLEAIVARGITTVDRRTMEVPGLAELIREAVAKYRSNELMHSDLLNDARLRVPCRTCRIEQPNVPLPAIKGELSNTGIPAFVICTKCKSTICCGCVLKPCKKALEEFVKKFTDSPEHHVSHPVTNERVKIQLRLIRKLAPTLYHLDTEKYRVEQWLNGEWRPLRSHVYSIDSPDFNYVASLWRDVYYTPDKQNTLDEDLRECLASIQGETIAFGGETHSIKECSKETLLAFIDQEHNEDFVIECDGQEFKVKKIILQARSPVFDAMLSSNNFEEAKENRMVIIDFDAETVQKMIEYFETDFVKDTSNCEVELYKLARKYQSQSFMNFTLRLIIHTLSNENASDRLEIAEVHDDEEATRMITLWKNSGAYLKDALNFESLFARLQF